MAVKTPPDGNARKDQHGITKDKKAQEQPIDKEAAQNAGMTEQRDAAKQRSHPVNLRAANNFQSHKRLGWHGKNYT